MSSLMLHCGANEVEWDTIEMSPTPDATDSWTPIPHAELIRGVKDRVCQSGLQIVQEHHGLTKEGMRYFGLMELTNGCNSEDYSLILGLRNSHDKSFPAGIAVGAGVFVCDNLSFSGEVNLARRHTRFIRRDLPRVIATAVGRISDLRHSQDERFAAYRQRALTDVEVHDLTIQALDVQAIGSTTIPKVLAEWRQPSHDFGEPTVWGFFNACTEVLKGYRIEHLPRRTMALHGLLDSYCGLAI